MPGWWASTAFLLLAARPPEAPAEPPKQKATEARVLPFPVVQLPHSSLTPRERAAHLLNRIGFGPRPGEIDALTAKGEAGLVETLERQLFPAAIADDRTDHALAELRSLSLTLAQMHEQYPNGKEAQRVAEEMAQGSREPQPIGKPRDIGEELVGQKLYRAARSERQLEELLTDFWFNHFNVDLSKGQDRWMVTSYERDAIRPHVFGRFRDLLGATATHPAMLVYLDNWLSVRDGFEGAAKRRRGINENYARELLELHTLGVEGGYSQQDVIEVARAFTGWTIDRPNEGGSFVFREQQHDFDAKKILGTTIAAGGGREDGEEILDLLARHPRTARRVATQLARRFVADDPPAALIDRVARAFEITGGDLRWVYLALFTSPEFWSREAYRHKVKTPFEFVVSAVRAIDAEVDPAVPALGRRVDQLGQPLYRCAPPTGWSNQAETWVNPGALVARINFGLELVSGRIPGVDVELKRFAARSGDGSDLGKRAVGTAGSLAAAVDRLAAVVPTEIAPATRQAIVAELSREERVMADGEVRRPELPRVIGLLLGSPDFQRR